MPDKAHIESDKMLSYFENDLTAVYAKAERRIQREIEPLLEEIYIEKDSATTIQRLKYAEKSNKKKEIVNKMADIINSVNEYAVKRINENQSEIYRINFEFMANSIIKQMKDNISKGGD